MWIITSSNRSTTIDIHRPLQTYKFGSHPHTSHNQSNWVITSGAPGSKALEATLLSLIIVRPKMFSIVPNLQTQKAVIIRLPKPFPYQDSHHVPWTYNVSLISSQTRKEEICYNISLGLSELTRSGRCYTLEELENRRKETGKSTIKPIKNRVTTKETEEFLKTIQKVDYSVIQQLK